MHMSKYILGRFKYTVVCSQRLEEEAKAHETNLREHAAKMKSLDSTIQLRKLQVTNVSL